MKAVRVHAPGGPEVLRYEDAPDPQPAEGRAIVRVRACALNHLDLWERRGLDRVKLPLPHISGADVAGEVLGTGQRVMLQPGLRCGACAACRRGDDNQCVRYDVLGLRSDGGYAELISIPLENLIPIPATLDFITAAAFPLTFLTAWHMLVTRGRLGEGDVVLVLAGGSGVGQAAIQLARHCGARVFATSAPEKAERTRALVRQLDPAILDGAVPLPHLRRVLYDEGALRPGYPWPEDPPLYSGETRGALLFMFGMTHPFYHWGELRTVHSCLASPHRLSPA